MLGVYVYKGISHKGINLITYFFISLISPISFIYLFPYNIFPTHFTEEPNNIYIKMII